MKWEFLSFHVGPTILLYKTAAYLDQVEFFNHPINEMTSSISSSLIETFSEYLILKFGTFLISFYDVS